MDRYKPRGPRPKSEAEAGDDVVESVREALQARDPGLGDAAAYVLTADLLDRVNWPEFAARAVEGAVAVDPALEGAPSVQALRERTEVMGKSNAGEAAALANGVAAPESATPFTEPAARKAAAALAERMKKVPALALSARSLQGDLALETGDRRGAIAAYKRIPSPSGALSVQRAEGRAGEQQ